MSDTIDFKLETYQHFKGGLYIKVFESTHTETGEILVNYICCASGEVFSRPKTMFYDKVVRDDYSGPRFIKIPPIVAKVQKRKLRLIQNGSS
jgi:hypothetical protein